MSEDSCYIWNKFSEFRIAMYLLINSNRFNFGILGVIVANTIKLVWDTYNLESDSENGSKASLILDIIFTIIFTLECILKIIGLGFILEKNTYLRDSWN